MRSILLAAALLLIHASGVRAACCYFSAKNADILQPAQKAFITWDPSEKIETFTVQPKFEGNALDFGMVIPTPSQPKLNEMPRDFFKHLAVYAIMRKRESPQSKLLPPVIKIEKMLRQMREEELEDARVLTLGVRKPTVVVLEAGVVGSLDYKIIEATRADDLFQWLKDNKYSYSGDEATLQHYIQKKWLFTVMKIDTMQMKRNKDGTFAGEVTPTRFKFASDKIVYPLKITQISVREKTEALFYVQAPFKVDLEADMSYQFTWVPMLERGIGLHPRRPPRQRRRLAGGVQSANPRVAGSGQGARLPLRRRPTARAEQARAHPDHDGMGPQTIEGRHRHRHRQGAVQRKGAECR